MLGNAFVAAGAISGAFGAVGWIAALRHPSILALIVSVLCYGLVPLIGGLGFVWYGLDLIEEDQIASTRRCAMRAALLEAVRDGATPAQIALRLRISSARDAENALDDLVRHGLLELDVTDDGELSYHAPAPLPASGENRSA
ncbi:hypothetical protein [Polyangium aurulentum]|uniref:hypothetical protein n=1 Tax=Polyangium aurulentum TaxID=2567896 RepID=UPI0010AEAE54|nr:hypothetical protein [Polyangium aurulentum]UQA61920.1 hypothetical protein E8A73_016190 [Polyangium aurulentum]